MSAALSCTWLPMRLCRWASWQPVFSSALRVWTGSTQRPATETALTAHLVKPEVSDDDSLLAVATGELQSRFQVAHITLQIERAAAAQACPQASDDVV